jgi:hypothetical protein
MDFLHRYHLAISFSLYVLGESEICNRKLMSLVFTSFIVTFKKGLYKYQLGQIAWTGKINRYP